MSKTISKTFRLQRPCVEALEQLVKAGRAETQTALLEMLVAREMARYDMEREDSRGVLRSACRFDRPPPSDSHNCL